MLAYVTALDLPGGLLIYAKGEPDVATYVVRHSGKRLEVEALDLCGALDDVLARVRGIADKVRRLRRQARARAPVPAFPAARRVAAGGLV